MKAKEELNALKCEVEDLNKKLSELSEEELNYVIGGVQIGDQASSGLINNPESLIPIPYIYGSDKPHSGPVM